jgi:methylenetetrahydrofolate reductase (NADPH)
MTIERLSFEFFPPNSAQGRRTLERTCRTLARYQPEYFSVTYGAGGSTRDRTRETIEQIVALGQPATPHLSIGMDDEGRIRELLDHYRELGVRHIVALRGDLPSGFGSSRQIRFAADLVRLIRAHSGDHFQIAVAAYPETHPDAPSPEHDVAFLKGKIDAGADIVITQYFYNADAYFDFVARCRAAHIEVPIVPGIMPITNYANLVRFSDNCGAEIPRWIRQRLAALQHDDEALRDFGADVVTQLCQRLLSGGVPGLHFYTLNQAGPTRTLLTNLGKQAVAPR